MRLSILSAACRLPGADTPDAFWGDLLDGTDRTQVVPTSRWNPEEFYGTDGRPGTSPSRWGTFVDDPWEFPAAEFGVREGDAAWIDPQQRLMLTCAREALTSAGVDIREHRSVGVFVGTSYASFSERVRDHALQGSKLPGAAILGVLNNMLAARVSHVLDLRGPALTVDSACSSVFVAMHLARRAIEAGDCELAIVGGTHMLMSPIPHLIMGRAGALSDNGRCRPFSAAANGIVLGEGVGAFVVAAADTAQELGWPTVAYVVGTAIDNDGRTLNPMAPRPKGQVETMQRAWRDAGLDPATASLIEAHGTGTPVGDPVEASSLTEAFPSTTPTRWLGSVKGNIGHLMSAAGVPSLLKVIWALRHRTIPPTLFDGEPREALGLREAGFEMPANPVEWASDGPRRAGLNAFGFGGTNAHLVLEEAGVADGQPADVTNVRGQHYALSTPPMDSSRVLGHPFLLRRTSLSLGEADYQAHVDASHPIVAEHRVGGRSILPATALCELMLTAAEEATGRSATALDDVKLHRPAGAGAQLSVRVSVPPDGRGVEVLDLRVEDASGLVARARVHCGGDAHFEAEVPSGEPSLNVKPSQLYESLAARGMQHGPSYRRIQSLAVDPRQHRVVAELRDAAASTGLRLDPIAADAALQCIAALLLDEGEDLDGLWIPSSIGRIELSGSLRGPLHAHVSRFSHGPDDGGRSVVRATVHVTGTGWEAADVRAVFHDVALKPIPTGAEARWFETVRWIPAPDVESSSVDRRRILDVSDEVDAVAAVEAIREAAKALPEHGELTVVTRNAFLVNEGGVPPRPEMAVAATYAAALSAEGVDCRVVDLDSDAPITAVEGPLPDVPLLTHRSTGFLRRVLDRAEAPHLKSLPDGVWLLPGGATGITASIASAIASPGRTLLLVGRTPIREAPDRLERIRNLRKLGARVIYLRADTRTDDVAPLLDAIEEYGPLVGVVYGAGVVRPGRALQQPADEMRAVLETKLQGAMALARALNERGQSPRVLLLSSVSGVEPERLGGTLVDYAAANAGLDALARKQRGAGQPWTAVSYSSWGEVGMAADLMPAAVLGARGLEPLEPSAAARAALRALSGDCAHYIVAHRYDPAAVRRSARPVPDDLVGFIQRFIADALGIEPQHITPDADFADLGLDSLDALELISLLEDHGFGPLSDAVVFEQRTIASLAAFLEGPSEQRPAPPAQDSPGDEHVGRVPAGLALQTRLDPRQSPFVYIRQTVDGSALDAARLARAGDALLHSTPVLRAPMHWEGMSLRRQAPVEKFEVEVLEYAAYSESALARLDDALANTPMVLDRPPLVRLALIRGPGDRQHVALTMHHAVVDGWSGHLVAQRLWRSYGSPDSALPTLPIVDDRSPPPDRESIAHWVDEIRRPWPSLPGVTGEPPVGPRRAVVRRLEVPGRLARGSQGTERFPEIAAAFARAIRTWAGVDEVVLQIATGRRERLAGRRDAIGSFADTVPIALASLDASADGVREAWERALAAGAPGLIDLAEHLPDAPDAGPRVASPFGLSVATFRGSAAPGFEVTDVVARTASGATRIGLTVWMLRDELGFAINYPPSWISYSSIAELANCLEIELEGHARGSAPSRSSEPPVVSGADRSLEALTPVTQSSPPSVPDSFLHVILKRCETSPDDCAAVARGGESVSYRELQRASERIGASLHRRGIARGDVVGVMLGGGIESLVALIGVLRTGAAWLPLEPEDAPDRQRFVLDVASPTVVLHDPSATNLAVVPAEKRVAYPEAIEDGRHITAPDLHIEGDDVAYILFTSGSEGRPKGVPIRHASLNDYLHWSVEMLGLQRNDRLLQTSSWSFDAVLRQVLAPLMCGATVHLTDAEESRDPYTLWSRAAAEQVTAINTSPALGARLAEAARDSRVAAPPLRVVTLGGERLLATTVREWRSTIGSGLRIVNLYGPTETTINATWHEVGPDPTDPIPIGHPLPGYTTAVLDSNGRESGEGELCVGGRGCFDGYLGDVSAPFVELGGARFYRTGDRVRRQPDGNLVYLGRLDDQVQVNGIRVEPGEVEAALGELTSVRSAAVVPRERGTSSELWAWVEASVGEWDEVSAREQLRSWLPDAFVPRRFVRVDELPLGPTGKVDRAKLSDDADLGRLVRSREVEGPATPAEHAVAEAWSTVLDRPVAELDRNDDFFGLGGDSMAAVEVCSKLSSRGTSLLYANPRLKDFAASLQMQPGADANVSREGARGALLPAQIGFLRSERRDSHGRARWVGRVGLIGSLDIDALQRAWTYLHRRHPMLTAYFPEGRIEFHELPPPPLEVVEDTSASNAPFEPDLAPESNWLVRGRLLQSNGRVYLEVAGHHLIGDGWSVAVLLREMCRVHDAFAASEEPVLNSIPEIAEVVAAANDRPLEDSTVAVWRSNFSKPVPNVLDPSHGKRQTLRVSRERDAQDFAELLGGLYRALRSSSGLDDIVIGVATSGRDLPIPGIDRVVAPLATVLPIRIRPKARESAVDAARRALKAALTHPILPGQLARVLHPLPLPPVSVVVTDMRFGLQAQASGLRIDESTMQTEMGLPDEIALQVSVRPGDNPHTRMRVSFSTTGSPPLDTAAALEDFADMALEVPTTFVNSVPSGRRAALITYLPPRDRLRTVLGADPAVWLPNEPRTLGTIHAGDRGQCEVWCLPQFADELTVSAAELAGLVSLVLQDAEVVALAGLLPSRVGYGEALRPMLNPAEANALSTGHATTAVAVAMTTGKVLSMLQRRWETSRVGVLGVGSIGRAVLSLMVRRYGPPAGLVLCDVGSRRGVVERFAEELGIAATVVDGGAVAPDELYQADLILGATSQPDVLDPRRLRSGTVVVDDSFPACFPAEIAHERMYSTKDVLLLGGGLVSLPDLEIRPDEDLVAIAKSLRHVLPTIGIPGCAADALIAPPSLGLLGPNAVDRAWEAAERVGLLPAELHEIGGGRIPTDIIESVRRLGRQIPT